MRGESPLHAAAMAGSAQSVLDLVASGVHKDALDNAGETALMKASQHGSALTAEALMRAGCNVNLRGSRPTCYTALDRAAQNG